ncbi:hypothetical protein [Parvimonas sp. G1967]|uniref:hypothetical protein n=1 Tax=Parvimonas sp. G1967 TaxID=3387695 RepID=UPI0039E45D84
MSKHFELVISIFCSFLSSIIGVFISIRYENYKIEKEKRKKENKQWDSFNKIMYEVRDWARDLEENPTSKKYPERYISPEALFNKLSCDEIPEKYISRVYEMARLMEILKYQISLQNPDLQDIKNKANVLGNLASELAREKNPNL